MPPEIESIPEPWRSFLRDLDETVNQQVDFHCIGGFVITRRYGFDRETQDMDVLSIAPESEREPLLQKGGKGSELHKKYKVYLDFVAVIQAYPENYDQRLTEMFSGQLQRIRLLAPDPYDLALMKLERNIERDREDVKYLARQGYIRPDQLRLRYTREMRSYVAAPERTTDITVAFWVEMIQEVLAKR